MAEIRINATGGLKLYDADDSHYAQIVAGTITSNVNAITLGHDVVSIVDNLALTSDSSVLKFGADNDTTLTHTDGTGLTLNSTNKLCFNDASQFIQGSSATVLSIGATDEIDLTATAVDLNGTLNVSGVATFQSTPVFPDGSLAVADLDIDGATDIGAAVVDADLFIVDDGAGGANRKVTASRIKTYAGLAVGDITGATALAATPALDDELILSDAGTLKRMDFSHIFNVPYFKFRSDGQTISNAADTLIQFDTEIEKSSGSAAFDTTNHRYVPTTAGRYIVHVAVRGDEDATGDRLILQIRKNGTVSTVIDQDINDLSSIQATALIECNGSSDYIDAIIYQNTGANWTVQASAAYSFFMGYRIIA